MRALYSVVNNITLKLSREIDIESWREIKFKVFGAKSLHVLLKGFMIHVPFENCSPASEYRKQYL